MKTLIKGVLLFLILPVLGAISIAVMAGGDAKAAPGYSTPISQTRERDDSCLPVNANAAAGSAVTLIIPQCNGYTYLCGLDFSVTENATAGDAWAVLNFSSTNFNSWAYTFAANTGAANAVIVDKTFSWNPAIRAPSPSVVITFASPAAKTNAKYNINAYYYCANQ